MSISTLVLRSGIGVGNPDVTGFVLHGLYPQSITPITGGNNKLKTISIEFHKFAGFGFHPIKTGHGHTHR